MRGESRLVQAVAATRTLRDDPPVVIDIGCGLGVDVGLRCFGPDLRVFGFDPNLDEIEHLAATEQHPGIEYAAGWVGLPTGHPFSVAQRGGDYWSRNPWDRLSVSAAAVASPDEAAEERRGTGPRLAGSDQRIVLGEYLAAAGVSYVDFVKLDVDGPDFEVLVSLEDILASGPVLGVGMEVNFFGSGAPTDHTLHNTDRFLKERGFELFNLSMRRYSTAALPARFVLPTPAETATGRILQGDALYFRDVMNPEQRSVLDHLRPTQVLKLACLFDLCDLPDCAAEVLLSARERVEPVVRVEPLLDALVPDPCAGRALVPRVHRSLRARRPHVLPVARPRYRPGRRWFRTRSGRAAPLPAPRGGTARARVAPRDPLDVGRREPADLVGDELLGVRPGRVAVRVVALDHDVVDADDVALDERRRVLDGAEVEVAPEHLRGRSGDVVPRAVHRVVPRHVVEPVDQTRDPADAALGQADLQVGEADRDQRVEPVDGREHGVAEEEHADGVGRRVGGGRRRGARRADVQVDDRAGLGARPHDRVPVAGVQRREPEVVRALAERDRLEPALGVAPDLCRADLRVEEPGDLAAG